MKRGEVWTAAGARNYTAKARPILVVQDDQFDATDSITVCPFTTDPTEAVLFRLPVLPDESNGLRLESRIMVDKITTMPRSRIGTRLGRLSDEDLVRLNRAIVVFLGIATPASGAPNSDAPATS